MSLCVLWGYFLCFWFVLWSLSLPINFPFDSFFSPVSMSTTTKLCFPKKFSQMEAE